VIDMNSQEEIYAKIVTVLEELFEIDAQQVSPQARLYEDLDIDSIDAVDLVVELKKITGKKIQPDDFKSVRSVQDVVDAVTKLLNDG
jgi:acyl carrier protein